MASVTIILQCKRNMSCLWDSQYESDNTLEKMAAAEIRPVCAGHVNQQKQSKASAVNGGMAES